MIIRNGQGYFIERVKENGLIITRVNINDGLATVDIYDPRIRQSSIRATVKTDREHIPWSYLFNFNLEEIADMPFARAKEHIWERYRNDKKKKIKTLG